ncbi:hypothetical protein ACFZB9_00275 [Kitasatospora sp. NPDC008050]|uniref:hypothetical protein n=1 Tax=Kitasatospora sp. NPDC008050 TaxID=3364021 RepID=UPI0036ED1A56
MESTAFAEPELEPEPAFWSGLLGRTPADLRSVDGRWVLRIGDWSTVLDEQSEVRHRTGFLRHRILVNHPDQAPFVHRYRLPWMSQLCAPMFEGSYDRLSAEADDPGLTLIDRVGGTDDWT